MKRLNKAMIRKMILKELESIGEDAILRRSDNNGTPPLNYSRKSSKCSNCMMQIDVCECGSMYEEECSEEESIMNECSCQDTSKTSVVKDYPFSKESQINHQELDYHGILKNILGIHMHNSHGENSMHSNKNHSHKKHGGAYMSKSQLYKVHEYSKKLYDMIPQGHNLEDWMRTKISQISDDISEVYHALDHDRHEGDV